MQLGVIEDHSDNVSEKAAELAALDSVIYSFWFVPFVIFALYLLVMSIFGIKLHSTQEKAHICFIMGIISLMPIAIYILATINSLSGESLLYALFSVAQILYTIGAYKLKESY